MAVRSIEVARERGVMTSAAVWSAKPRDAVTSRAVPRPRVPASADVRTSDASSAGLRAAESSSCGSMPSATQRPVRDPVEQGDHRLGRDAEPAHRGGRDLRRRQGQRDREGLGHHLADDHREHRRDEHREDRGGRRGRRRGQAEVLERPEEQRPDRRARDEAEDQRGQRDAELARRELGREPAVRGEHRPGPGLPRVDGALHGRTVEGDERELGRDEQRGAHGEHDAEQQQEPFGHGAAGSGGCMASPAYGPRCRSPVGPRPAPGAGTGAPPPGSSPRGSRIHRGVDPDVG